MKIECPYCEVEQDVCHDDGQGYEEDVLHEMECEKCHKNFTFTTNISFSYEAYKADCLNGKPHKLRATTTIPIEYTSMECTDCEYRRRATPSEIAELNKPVAAQGEGER